MQGAYVDEDVRKRAEEVNRSLVESVGGEKVDETENLKKKRGLVRLSASMQRGGKGVREVKKPTLSVKTS